MFSCLCLRRDVLKPLLNTIICFVLGFSDTSGKTWLPVANTSKLINVKIQTEDKKSHLNFYKKLVALRQVPEVQNSELKMLILGNIFVFARYSSYYTILTM